MNRIDIKKALLEPIIMSKIEFLRVLLIFAGFAAIAALISATVGVIFGISGIFLLGVAIYNNLIGKEERNVIDLTKEEKTDSS